MGNAQAPLCLPPSLEVHKVENRDRKMPMFPKVFDVQRGFVVGRRAVVRGASIGGSNR